MIAIEKALLEISKILDGESVPYMVIGGTAVLLWGGTRSTQDIDVTVWVSDKDMPETVARLIKRMKTRVSDPSGHVRTNRVLPVDLPCGIPVDIIFGLLPIEETAIQNAQIKEIAGKSVRVCRVQDLLVHKILSSRPRDIEDMRFLISRYGKTVDKGYLDQEAENLARELARPEILSNYRGCWKA